MWRERIVGQRTHMLEVAIQALLRCGATGTLRKRIAMLIQEEALLCVVRRFPLPREAPRLNWVVRSGIGRGTHIPVEHCSERTNTAATQREAPSGATSNNT